MKKQLFKYSNIEVKSSDEDKREITAIASKEVADRDGDIVRVGQTPKEGINITEYRKNPVILFGHNSHDLPVAKATRIWKDNKQLMVKIKFPEPEISSMGDTIYKLIKNDYLRALSIGFRPKWDDAIRMDKTGGYDFKSSDLFEISIVPVGANQAALVQQKELKKAIDDGVIDQLELDELELFLNDLDFDNEIETVLDEMQKEADDETEGSKTVEDIIDDISKLADLPGNTIKNYLINELGLSKDDFIEKEINDEITKCDECGWELPDHRVLCSHDVEASIKITKVIEDPDWSIDEISTNDVQENIEQKTETLPTKEEEFDPYAYIFESVEKDQKPDAYEHIYDLLGLK